MDGINETQQNAVDDRIWNTLQAMLNQIANEGGYIVSYDDVEPGFKAARFQVSEAGKELSVMVFCQRNPQFPEFHSIQFRVFYPFCVRADAMNDIYRYIAETNDGTVFTSLCIRRANGNPYYKTVILQPSEEQLSFTEVDWMFAFAIRTAQGKYEDLQKFAA